MTKAWIRQNRLEKPLVNPNEPTKNHPRNLWSAHCGSSEPRSPTATAVLALSLRVVRHARGLRRFRGSTDVPGTSRTQVDRSRCSMGSVDIAFTHGAY